MKRLSFAGDVRFAACKLGIRRFGQTRENVLPELFGWRLRNKGYASRDIRAAARSRGVAPVIPHKANDRNRSVLFARTLYKARPRIERNIGRLKRFKRVARRCEKTARNFRSIVSFAAGPCLIKVVLTA